MSKSNVMDMGNMISNAKTIKYRKVEIKENMNCTIECSVCNKDDWQICVGHYTMCIFCRNCMGSKPRIVMERNENGNK